MTAFAATRWRPLLVVLSIGAAVAGQWSLHEQSVTAGLLLYTLAVAAVLVALFQGAQEYPELAPEFAQEAFQSPNWVFLLLSLISALLAFSLNADLSFRISGFSEAQFTFAGVIAWVLSVSLFLAAFWKPEKSLWEWRDLLRSQVSTIGSGWTLHVRWTAWALLAVLILGAIFYFRDLALIPAEMTSDHAEKLLDVNDILEGHYPVFFFRNTGREPFQFYWTAFLMWVTGLPLSYMALKFGTALLGFLTIPVTFLLAREIMDDVIGVLAAFFVAVSHWSVTISRIGLRYPLSLFFTALSFYFFWRALKYQHRNDFLVTGLCLGVGLYGYIPSRNIPLVIIAILGLWLILDARSRFVDKRALVISVVAMLGLCLVVFMPLLRYSIDNPEMFWYRALTRVSSTERPIQGSIAVVFLQNLLNLVLMFNWRGDEVWVSNINTQPALDLISGALLVLGVAITAYALVRTRKPDNLYLLVVFAALLIPSALSLAFPGENPSMVRTGAAIPFAAILLARPIALFTESLKGSLRFAPFLRWSVLIAILLPITVLNYRWYFIEYDSNYRQHAQNSSEVANIIRGFAQTVGDLDHAYFVAFPHWTDGRAIAIDLGNLRWSNNSLDAAEFLDSGDASTNQLFIVNPADTANYARILARYPFAQSRLIYSRTPGKDFYSIFVPAKSAQ